MQRVSRVAEPVKLRRVRSVRRPDDLRVAAGFFQELAGSAPSVFVNALFRNAAELLLRLGRGRRVPKSRWYQALQDARFVSAANRNQEPRPRHPFSLAFSPKRMAEDGFDRRVPPTKQQVRPAPEPSAA